MKSTLSRLGMLPWTTLEQSDSANTCVCMKVKTPSSQSMRGCLSKAKRRASYLEKVHSGCLMTAALASLSKHGFSKRTRPEAGTLEGSSLALPEVAALLIPWPEAAVLFVPLPTAVLFVPWPEAVAPPQCQIGHSSLWSATW